MTTIYCSNKLKDLLGKAALSEPGPPGTAGDWNAHLFYFGRRKHLIFVHSQSRYCLFIEDILKSDVAGKLESLFMSRLMWQLVFDGVIREDDAAAVRQLMLPVALSPTNRDRSVLGTINEYVYNYEVYRTTPRWQDQPIGLINHTINDGIASVRGKYQNQAEVMKHLLADSMNMDAIHPAPTPASPNIFLIAQLQTLQE